MAVVPARSKPAAEIALDLLAQIKNALDELNGWGLEALLDLYAVRPDADRLSGLVMLRASLEEVRTKAHDLEAMAETNAAREMKRQGVKVLPLPHVGLVAERKGESKITNWDHDALRREIVRSVTVDPDTGEIVSDEIAEAARAAVEQFATAAHVDYWRKGALRAIGVDPDGYCHTEFTRTTVVIRRGEAAQALLNQEG